MSYVLDTSAVLAVIRGEPGADRVDAVLADATISAVNLQEVYKKLLDNGIAPLLAKSAVTQLKLRVVVHDEEAAWHAAMLAEATRNYGSGLGDRSCLSLALQSGSIALTADREWANVEIEGLQIELIR